MSRTKEQILKIMEEYTIVADLSGDFSARNHVLTEYNVTDEELRSWLSNPEYYQCSSCSYLEQLPALDQLAKLREQNTPQSRPTLPIEIADDCFGWIKIQEVNAQFMVIAQLGEEPEISWRLEDLEKDNPTSIEARLKIGWALYSMYTHRAQQLKMQIPHPLESFHMSAPDFTLGEAWKFWAIQPPAS